MKEKYILPGAIALFVFLLVPVFFIQGSSIGGSSIPSGPAGGTLTGTYPNPGVNASAIGSGLLPNSRGGTGLDTSASAGIPSLTAGTWVFSTTLPGGTRGVTQSPGTSATSLATTAFVAAAIVPPPFGSLTAPTAAIANTETLVTFFSQAPGLGVGTSTFKAGDMVRVAAQGSCTTGVMAPTTVFRVRIGPTTLTGTAMTIAGPQLLGAQTSKHFDLEGYITIRSVVTTTATVDSESTLITDPTLLALGASSFGGSSGNTFDPTVTNRVELTFQSGDANASCTFFMALLERII